MKTLALPSEPGLILGKNDVRFCLLPSTALTIISSLSSTFSVCSRKLPAIPESKVRSSEYRLLSKSSLGCFLLFSFSAASAELCFNYKIKNKKIDSKLKGTRKSASVALVSKMVAREHQY